MSISSRITSIEEHIGNAYDKIDDLGIDLTNVDKNIDNIASLLDTVYEEYPKVSATGTQASLNGTKKGKLSLDLKGNSTQDGTPSPTNEVPIYSAGENVNLLNIESVTGYVYSSGLPSYIDERVVIDNFGSNNITFHDTTTLYAIALTNIIQLKANTTYTISFNRIDSNTVTNTQWFVYDYNGTNYSINYRDNNVGLTSKTFTTNSQGKIAIAFGMGQVKGESTISNIKIEQGSIATPYTPYGMGSLWEKISNKNLLKNTKETGSNNGITFTVNQDKSITMSGTATAQSNFYLYGASSEYVDLGLPLGNYVFSGITGGSTSTYINYLVKKDKNGNISTYTQTTEPKTFTINEGDTFRVFLRVISGYSFGDNPVTAKPMIEPGSTATTYTSHAEQTYTIPVQQPMRKIGDVKDEFYKASGVWYERHNIEYIELDGTETITIHNSNTSRTVFKVQTGELDFKPIAQNVESAKCNYFQPVWQGATWKNGDISTRSGEGANLYITMGPDMTEEQFETWLSTHITKVLMIYQTPQDLPCTSEQISILENLPKSYNEQTNIYSLDVTPAYIEAKALKGE